MCTDIRIKAQKGPRLSHDHAGYPYILTWWLNFRNKPMPPEHCSWFMLTSYYSQLVTSVSNLNGFDWDCTTGWTVLCIDSPSYFIHSNMKTQVTNIPEFRYCTSRFWKQKRSVIASRWFNWTVLIETVLFYQFNRTYQTMTNQFKNDRLGPNTGFLAFIFR